LVAKQALFETTSHRTRTIILLEKSPILWNFLLNSLFLQEIIEDTKVMKDINSLLTELIESSGATVIISNPDTIPTLQKEGLPLDQSAPETPEGYVEKLFEIKKTLALDGIKTIPSFPNVPIPTMGLLYNEVVECVLFGLNGAAITLSSILVEYALKQAIVRKKHSGRYDESEWDRIENIELHQAIKEAKELELLDSDTEQQLNDFRNQTRNPYLHYNIKKLTRGVRANKVKKLDIKTGKIEEVQLDAQKDPVLWPYAKKFVDGKSVSQVLNFVCRIVRLLFVEEKDQSHY